MWLSSGKELIFKRIMEITEITEIIENNNFSIFLDSSFLLGLLRINEGIAKEMIEKLESVKENIVVSYIVKEEFQRNVESYNNKKVEMRIRDSFKHYNLAEDKALMHLSSILTEINSQNVIGNRPLLNKLYMDYLSNRKKITEEIKKINHRQIYNGEKFNCVVDFANKLFEMENFIDRPSVNEFLDLILKGHIRMIHKFPPGYKDFFEKYKKDLDNSNNPKEVSRYLGDYFIWDTILNNIDGKRDIIFITDDEKEDWWDPKGIKTNDFKPRKELIEEFNSKITNPSSQKLHMLTFRNAIELLKASTSNKSFSDAVLINSNYIEELQNKLITEIKSDLDARISESFAFRNTEVTWEFDKFSINECQLLADREKNDSNIILHYRIQSSLYFNSNGEPIIVSNETFESLTIEIENIEVVVKVSVDKTDEITDLNIESILEQNVNEIATNLDFEAKIIGIEIHSKGILRSEEFEQEAHENFLADEAYERMFWSSYYEGYDGSAYIPPGLDYR